MRELLANLRWRDALDILLVAFVLYRVFLLFRGTRAVQMVLGLVALVAAWAVARALELRTLQWILDAFWAFWVIILVVVFQPELRRALAWVGQGRLLRGLLGAPVEERDAVAEVAAVADNLAARRIGALIVLERSTGLRHYAELGVRLDALVSADLLVSLFLPYSPLHDGAVFVQGGRVVAAGCFLPLSRSPQVGRTLGTRHRAALGVTEETDAVAVVVSEETGAISVAAEGRLEAVADGDALRGRLSELMGGGEATRPARLVGGLARLWARAPDQS
ncbi:MAG TPA: diadenylate cyclase CdaA [Methylomirabilota bacterium]|nr:diadenylate cyclase CdaA [Methylomirabilota bacterium]